MQTAERLEQYERITGREAEDFLARAVKLVQERTVISGSGWFSSQIITRPRP